MYGEVKLEGGSISASGPVSMAEPAGPLDVAFSELLAQQEHMNQLAGLLERRLRDVLAAAPNCGEGSAEKPSEATCAMHERALVAAKRQRDLNRRVQDLIDRIAI